MILTFHFSKLSAKTGEIVWAFKIFKLLPQPSHQMPRNSGQMHYHWTVGTGKFMPNTIQSLPTDPTFSTLTSLFYFFNKKNKEIVKYFFVTAYFAANLMKHMHCASHPSMHRK